MVVLLLGLLMLDALETLFEGAKNLENSVNMPCSSGNRTHTCVRLDAIDIRNLDC